MTKIREIYRCQICGNVVEVVNKGAVLSCCGEPMKLMKENTYAWVQRNIRYLAYEAGISAHQPALPAETIRKRYGDCKAMSLLLKTLLRAQGFDARQTDIGTDDVPSYLQTRKRSPFLSWHKYHCPR